MANFGPRQGHAAISVAEKVKNPISGATRHISSALQVLPPFLITLILVVATVIAAAIITIIILRMTPRRFRVRHPGLDSLLKHKRTRTIMFLVVAIILFSGVVPATPLHRSEKIIALEVLSAIFILMLGWAAILAVDVVYVHQIARRQGDIQADLTARKHATQWHLLRRLFHILIVMITLAGALMLFPAVRRLGLSLLASAGAAGIVVGLAARPVLSNLIAGTQLAITQPLRLEDAVIINDQWGWIEEITSTYIVVRIWNWQRMIVPLSWLLEHPFQNWTRESSELIGTVHWHVDYTVPVDVLRAKLEEIVRSTPLWSGKVVVLQVTHALENTIELRALVSGRDSSQTWDLRCYVREKMIEFLQKEYPHALPRRRVELEAERR
jgi:small-conductance mechanosensitive channel